MKMMLQPNPRTRLALLASNESLHVGQASSIAVQAKTIPTNVAMLIQFVRILIMEALVYSHVACELSI